MAEPFKKQTVRYYSPEGKRCRPDTPGAVRRVEASRKWYGTVGGRAIALCRDKAKAHQLLNKLLTDAAMREHGLADPHAGHKRRPLADHIGDWERDLLNRGRTPKHASLSAGRVRRAVEACKFASIPDLSASRVQEYLAELRQGGAGVATCNHVLTALKMFCRWLVKDRRAAGSPLAHLSAGNAQVDRRHRRRDLSGEELALLLEVTRQAPTRFGLTGPDRAMLYAVAVYTGLRASELASLAPESFALDTDPPTVTVEAGYSKHRREDVLPLHAGLAARLRAWLAGKPLAAPLWPGKWATLFKAGPMLHADLEAARKAWIGQVEGEEQMRREEGDFLAYRDGEGRVADFHALRHTFISNLARAGVTPKVTQALARHSTITLTLDRYAHVGLHDVAAGVRALPPLPGDGLEAGRQPMRATGTDGAIAEPRTFGCLEVARTADREEHRPSSAGTEGRRAGRGQGAAQGSAASSVVPCCHRESSEGAEEAPPGFEPGMADLQSAALPLGEGAGCRNSRDSRGTCQREAARGWVRLPARGRRRRPGRSG